MSEIKLDPSWLKILKDEFSKQYMFELKAFIEKEIKSGKKIYPVPKNFFAALNATPFDKVKVVIIGQDPYHGPGQAHGLSFSVMKDVVVPPSLKNIYKELLSDLGITPPKHGYLHQWAEQGVLLLNNVLSVQDGMPASHQGKGWEKFTDRVIHEVNDHKENVVFILWGSHAQKKASFVDRKKHYVIETPHPSPLSSYRGFFGSKPFSKTNDYLKKNGMTPIDWSLNL